MKQFDRFVYTVIITIACFCSYAQQQIKHTDHHITYMGRVRYTDTAAELSWPGTTATVNFTGNSISAELRNESGSNIYNVIVDNKVTQVITVTNERKVFTLAEGLSSGTHTVSLFKRTEHSKTFFYGFHYDKAVHLQQPAKSKRLKLEFYGNSITCGRGVEDTAQKDRGDVALENHYKTYAAITARHYNAEYNCIAKSGIGIMISWFPLTMPEMYDRYNQNDTVHRWDFKQFTPDIVVINLFQNDSWLVKKPEHPEFKKKFGTTPPDEAFIINAYQSFVRTIRSKYPTASIICCLGNMDATKQSSPWPGYIQKAIAGLNDPKLYSLIFPYKGTPWHPLAQEQQVMADQLIRFIDENINTR
jgi:hypothetical protein